MSIVLQLATRIESIITRCLRFLQCVWSRRWRLVSNISFLCLGRLPPFALTAGHYGSEQLPRKAVHVINSFQKLSGRFHHCPHWLLTDVRIGFTSIFPALRCNHLKSVRQMGSGTSLITKLCFLRTQIHFSFLKLEHHAFGEGESRLRVYLLSL